MNELQILTVQGTDCYEVDGTAFLKLEHVARGLGFTTLATSGNECVRWNTVHKYLSDLGVATSCNGSNYRECCPEYIPENIFYRLAMKAKNEAAETFQAKIADEVIPSIRRTGGYLTPELAKALADLPAVMELMEGMEERLSALERRGTALPARLEALPFGAEPQAQVPGAAFRKRWMRTVSEKLNLLQVRFDMTHNELLHQLYKILEKENGVVLEEEKLRTMEEYELEECSVLTAIFYNPDLRDNLQGTIDYNLAPENRGW